MAGYGIAELVELSIAVYVLVSITSSELRVLNTSSILT